MSLKEYQRKRKFEKTPEPKGVVVRSSKRGKAVFVIQKHAASREHYDFRLEIDGVLVSWAVPKGPSLMSNDPRLAVKVEDHPLPYGKFEGVIPKGNYGAGTVMIWDTGTFHERGSPKRKESDEALRAGMAKGHITFILEGEKLRGEFALVKIKKKNAPENGWLLLKKHDAYASRHDVLSENRSVVSGRTMQEIASQSVERGDVWLPKKGKQKPPKGISPLVKPAREKRSIRLKKQREASPLPRRIRVMEPAFGHPPSEKGWIFESFRHGNRAIAEVEPHSVKIYSRAFLPYDKKYPKIVSALKSLKTTAVFDGEIVTKGKDTVFEIGDLLFHEGKDLRGEPLSSRKKELSQLRLSAPLEAAETASRREDLKTGSQMLVAKKLDSPYVSGMTKEWLRFRSNAKAAKTGKVIGRGFDTDRPPLTHLDKIYWPDEKITKGDLLNYYDEIAETILPHLVDRPQSLHRQPDGIRNQGFFHKDMSSFLPKRIETVRVHSASSGKTINYALCQDKWSLLYLVNLGCIELNPWLSRHQNIENPDLIVIDLDPDENPMNDVVKVARHVHDVLKQVGAKSYCKTSGATGLHICVPTGGRFDYDLCRRFAETVCRKVQQRFPSLTSVERNPAKRRRKIYLDFLQNRRGQTLAAPYCVRPRPHAQVSTPLQWSEVKAGLKPEAFTIKTIARRIKKFGDLWKPLLEESVDIDKAMKKLDKISE